MTPGHSVTLLCDRLTIGPSVLCPVLSDGVEIREILPWISLWQGLSLETVWHLLGSATESLNPELNRRK